MLNIDLLLRSWVEKTVDAVEKYWLSGKEKVPGEAVSNDDTDNQRSHQYWFPWKRCSCKQCFLLSTFQTRFSLFNRLTSMVSEMGGKWPYSCCFTGFCFQDLFKTCVVNIKLCSIRFVIVHVVYPCNCIDTATFWKKNPIQFYQKDQIFRWSISFARRTLISISVDEMQLLGYVNLTTNFNGLLLKMEIVLFAFTWRLMSPATCLRLGKGFCLGWGVCKNLLIISVVCLYYDFCRISSASCFFV